VRPIAEVHRPWDALEKAIARADLEQKKPDDALRRLEPLRISSPDDFDVWSMLGEAQCASGDSTSAIESWRHAVSMTTADRNTRRPVAMILAGCRDPEARASATQFLGEFPDDRELKAKLEADSSGLPAAPCPK
jgi:predicted Zn-dependent protease